MSKAKAPDPHSKQLRFDVSIYLQSQNPRTLKSPSSAVLQSEHFNYLAPKSIHPNNPLAQAIKAINPRHPENLSTHLYRLFEFLKNKSQPGVFLVAVRRIAKDLNYGIPSKPGQAFSRNILCGAQIS
jgi:hypothetical protein